MGAAGGCSALQVGNGYSRVAFQLQKFNPLFTLDFTQITVMQFYSIREYSQKVRVTLSRKFLILFSLTVWPNSLTTSLGIFPNTVKLHNSEWVKTTVNRWLKILAYKPHWSGTSLLEAPKYCRQPPQAKVSNCRLELKPTLIEVEVWHILFIRFSVSSWQCQ